MANERNTASPEQLLAQVEWVRRIASALVGRGDADEVVQQAYLQALSAPPRAIGNLRGWLTTVVRNVARKASALMRDARGTSRVPQRRLRRSILRSRSRAPNCIAASTRVLALDEPYRGTLLMRFFDDLSAEAIATARAAGRGGEDANQTRSRAAARLRGRGRKGVAASQAAARKRWRR